MPSSVRASVLLAVRVVLVGAGLSITALTVYHLATMPPAPPDSDGFVTGLAVFFGSIIVVLALGAASLGVVLPTLLGADDGFNRWQRLLLKSAAGLVGGGFLLGLAYGIATQLQYGFLLWLGTIVLGVLVVLVAVGWRVVEALVRLVVRIATSPS